MLKLKKIYYFNVFLIKKYFFIKTPRIALPDTLKHKQGCHSNPFTKHTLRHKQGCRINPSNLFHHILPQCNTSTHNLQYKEEIATLISHLSRCKFRVPFRNS
jgi:hypothetical protein